MGPEVPPDAISLNYSVKRNLTEVASALRKPVSDVTVLMLDRPRHADLIKQCREAGARIRLIRHVLIWLEHVLMQLGRRV